MADKKWYVLRTAGGKEKKAKEYLEKEIERNPNLKGLVSQILIPTETTYAIKNNKRIANERLLYSGYVFIQTELSPELQYTIRSLIPGMSGFLTERTTKKGSNEREPIPLTEEEVKRLLGQQDEDIEKNEIIITEVDYKVGDSVKINDGPFKDFEGTIEEIIEERSKLKVIVMIFGRRTPLELNFNQVTKE